jgi:fermentation-respiration switch protein FrsA (DUF1100 family)
MTRRAGGSPAAREDAGPKQPASAATPVCTEWMAPSLSPAPIGDHPGSRARPAWPLVLAVGVLLQAACGGPTATPGPPSRRGWPAASPSLQPVSRRCPTELSHVGGAPVQTFSFSAGDGTRLYGAAIGRGPVGVVLANDVPHPFCQEIPPAAFLARKGYLALVFDYRDRGSSTLHTAYPERLDLDVAGAVARLRTMGVSKVVLFGSYAGVAASIVAAVRTEPAVDAVIGFSPAAYQGQYVNGPFGPESALQDAPKLRVPALYATTTDDPFVSLAEVKRLYRATKSETKSLVSVSQGPGGWYLLQYDQAVQKAVLRFLSENT